MITERYCSPKVSKLLKEKGFDIPVWTRYEDNGEVIFGDKYNWNNSPKGQISAPTQSMVMDWLREVHNIFIIIEPHAYDYINEKNKSYVCSLWVGDIYLEYIGTRDYPSYKEACDVAIKFCLEKLV